MARDIWSEEGVRGFYRGFWSRPFSAMICSSAMVVGFETTYTFFEGNEFMSNTILGL